MGTGSGIQSLTCKDLGFNNIISADINKNAVENLKKLGFNSIYSDLFSNLNNKKFDASSNETNNNRTNIWKNRR